MNIGGAIDRAILSVFPGWARRRMVSRLQTEFLRKTLRMRGLEAAAPHRLSGRAEHKKQGPKDKTKTDLETTRAQARDLYRHNPYARGVINTIVANLIGCGIKPQARVILPKKFEPDERMNDALEEAWKVWSDGCDPTGKAHYYEQQAMIERELFVAGETLLIFSEAKDGRGIPLTTEVIPSERLSMKDNTTISGGTLAGKKIMQGIEYNDAGGVAAYWIYPNHPWDSVYGSDNEVRVPAERVIHFYDEMEPGSVRGLTRFLCVAGAFEGYVQWLDWLLTKERVSSAFALAFLENPGFGLASPAQTGDTTDLEDEAGNEIDYLEGGIIAHLKSGEDIKGVQSGVQAAAVDLLAQVFLRVIARGLDVSYETVARDLSKVTYLSARQGENQDRRHWEPQQERMNRRVNIPVWRQVQTAAYMAGKLPAIRGDLLPRHLDVDFVRPGWPWIDPSKDVAGDIAAIGAGLQSPLETIIRKGGDPYKVLKDIEQFQKWVREMGLELTLFQPPKPVGAPATEPEDNNGDESKETKAPAGKKPAEAA